jgi:hypothetical protein
VIPFIDDGLEYKNNVKSNGYDLVEDETDTVIGVTP